MTGLQLALIQRWWVAAHQDKNITASHYPKPLPLPTPFNLVCVYELYLSMHLFIACWEYFFVIVVHILYYTFYVIIALSTQTNNFIHIAFKKYAFPTFPAFSTFSTFYKLLGEILWNEKQRCPRLCQDGIPQVSSWLQFMVFLAALLYCSVSVFAIASAWHIQCHAGHKILWNKHPIGESSIVSLQICSNVQHFIIANFFQVKLESTYVMIISLLNR